MIPFDGRHQAERPPDDDGEHDWGLSLMHLLVVAYVVIMFYCTFFS